MADNTTYGDSEERRTRTPIRFRKVEGAAGRYHPPVSADAPSLQKFISTIADKFSTLPGNSIEVDPSQTDDPNRVVRHEGVHALLNGIDLSAVNKNIPAYSKIAAAFPSSGYGDPNTEIPAYAATGELGNIYGHPIAQNWMDEYTNQLQAALLKNNPALGQKYGQFVTASQSQGAQPNASSSSQ